MPFAWNEEEMTTYGDVSRAMDKIFAIPDVAERQHQADKFMEAYRADPDQDSPDVADSNVGYLAGYYGRDTMVAMLRLFRVSHPVFGGPQLAAKVTPEGAFVAGEAIGQRLSDEAQN